jgi:hypothetical protein
MEAMEIPAEPINGLSQMVKLPQLKARDGGLINQIEVWHRNTSFPRHTSIFDFNKTYLNTDI